MRHRVSKYKLNRTSSHRKAMLINMAHALFKHEQISTTLIKAKNLRPYAEKIITIAKKGDLNSKRKTLSILKDKKIIDKIFTTIAKRYESRKGGYIRIIKNGFRYGDSAPQAIIELVDRDIKAKGIDSGPIQKKKTDDTEDNNKQETDKSNEQQDAILSKEAKDNEEIAKKLANKQVSNKPTTPTTKNK